MISVALPNHSGYGPHVVPAFTRKEGVPHPLSDIPEEGHARTDPKGERKPAGAVSRAWALLGPDWEREALPRAPRWHLLVWKVDASAPALPVFPVCFK